MGIIMREARVQPFSFPLHQSSSTPNLNDPFEMEGKFTACHASFNRSSTIYNTGYRDCRRIDDLTRHFSECELSFNERRFDFGTLKHPRV